MAIDYHQYSQKLQQLLDAAVPLVIITIADARGSIPQILGAKAIVTGEGLLCGTVGGGKIETRAVSHAQRLLETDGSKQCELVTWNLQTDVGMTCGGEVRLLFEVACRHDWRIAIFGAGHVAQSLVPMLLQLDCAVTCLDSRADWLARLQPHPRLRIVCCENLADRVAELDPASFFVLMTQGHATDLPILAKILENIDAPYVGVIGSAQKAKVLRRDLKNAGVPEERLSAFYCPIGLPLGMNTPPEIAISIIAQLIQQRDRLGVVQQKTKQF